ncbi:MFS transporter [Paraurantiacibacter namhicola]|uniref:Major Facilitator Superfamily protein n=1 Tax=Paraurantiacibacter namhicola TaxID=645517 RepID=A0A1C7D7A0_9SPHN|nr:MFS transporter [Paraurantiacibacter namhicola]ANU07349.1 Major Facilitator Superfamily protein [Paraurantiacibacter namhicola]
MSGPAGGWGEARYALASLGAHLGFMPLLVLLLPRRVEALSAQPEIDLSILLVIGGLTASGAHIAAGAWSDRWLARRGTRRGLIAIGTAALAATYLLFAAAETLLLLGAALVTFQLALNVMFAPLGALLADHVPDTRKGRVAGMLNAALPFSYGGVSVLGWLFPRDAAGAFLLLAIAVPLLMLPLLLRWPFAGLVSRAEGDVAIADITRWHRRDFMLAWWARLFVQAGAALVTGYIFLYLTALQGRLGTPPGGTATDFLAGISLAALCCSFVAAIGGGWLSDRLGRRKAPLCIFALALAACLLAMGQGGGWLVLAVAYPLFGGFLAAFLAIDAALVGQLLTGHPSRGTLLGVMNLTNTLPGVMIPAFALVLLDGSSIAAAFDTLLLGVAIAAALAGILVLAIRSQR